MTIDSAAKRPFEYLQLPNQVAIGNKVIGQGRPIFVVAEIGCNHNGNVELAKKMVEEAAKAGADAVKFQKRDVEETFIKEMRDQKQVKTLAFGKTYGEYRRFQEMTMEEFSELKRHAEKLGLFFFVTPFDFKSVDFLEELQIDAYKISSFDVTNYPLVQKIARLKKPIVLSIGMSSLEEIDGCLETIFKYHNDVIINHCISTYPTPLNDMNLKNILYLKERYHPLPIGYSGHEKGIMPTIMAAAMGATTVERHVTLDKNLPGPDQATVSLDMNELKNLILHLRNLEVVFGDSRKIIRDSERKAREKHSKSIVAKIRIPAGTTIGVEMFTFKSPGSGLKPYEINGLLGKIARFDIEEDTIMPKEALNW
ncbi:MAG TPA: N-acetylneuraminate synthase family protein [Patescibacteria group bacterium]|nr:N-acetylneuraminate synthase family protein [Patescibacteria group bacterium]